MKLIYFIPAFLFIVFQAQSQYQFRTGINLANITASESGINYTSRMVSYHVGVVGNMEFSENLFLQPGLLFTGKGSQHQLVKLLLIITIQQQLLFIRKFRLI
ncbi:MAG: outer membrane beta-barrel protein [Chitinophagaceae bacterium]